MIDVRALGRLDASDLWRVAAGYTSDSKYAVVHADEGGRVSFELRLVALAEPYVKKYDHYDEETVARYNRIRAGGYSFGAYDGELLVGLLIAEAQAWNRSLVVSEFHVAETHRAAGIGRRLMERAVEAAGRAGLRIIVCETQNTNANSIAVYHKLGFRMEGVDLSLYRNTDYPDGEMAVFMKRRLP